MTDFCPANKAGEHQWFVNLGGGEQCTRCNQRKGIRPEPAKNTEGLSRRDHPGTAKQAARKVRPRSGTQRHRVLQILRDHPNGLTDEEMQDILEMGANTQRPRRVELVTQGWVVDSGERRKTRNDFNAIVWRFVT